MHFWVSGGVAVGIEVFVNGNGPWALDKALRVLKKKLTAEGLFKDLRRHAHFEKPGDRRRRKREESRRRRVKAARHWREHQAKLAPARGESS